MTDAREREKAAAARRAVEEVEDGMALGLGSGSTARYVVEELGKRAAAGLSVRCIATSGRTEALARAAGLTLVTFADSARLDLAIDGADEFDPRLDLVKGRGGALLHEKIVAEASARFVVVCDSSKRVEHLGAAPVPVEVVRFGWETAAARIDALGGHPELRCLADGSPFVTEEGHYVLDAAFGPLRDPAGTARELKRIAGVVEHGLFLDLAELVVMGLGEDAVVFER